MNLYDYLLANARDEDAAIISRREAATYGDLTSAAVRMAVRLKHAGVERGQRVGILAENSSFWVASYLAILKIAAVAVPFPNRLPTDKLRALAECTQTVVLCVDHARLAHHRPALADFVVLAPEERTDAGSSESVPTEPVREESALAELLFTSGSTGEPNAVMISHRNVIANTESISAYLGLRRDDRMMVVLPFDYCFGLSQLHTHLRAGGSIVLNNASQFSEDVLDDIEHFACTGFAGVPALYQQLLRRSTLPRRALPSLRHVQQAGGNLPPQLIDEFRAALPHVRFFVMYGQTEATSRLSYLPPERLVDKLGSIGRGIPGVRLRVVTSTGEEAAVGEVGELVAEGDNVALGYWLPNAPKDSFRGGKLYTGDLGFVDDDGFVFLTGRMSDFIKPYGHRISSKEIEDVLAELSEVVESAVVGVPDPVLGEAAKAYVVTRDRGEIPLKTIVDHCKGRLPPYAVPREVVYLPALPKNDTQKVMKQMLPREAAATPIST